MTSSNRTNHSGDFWRHGDLTWRKLAPALYNLLLDQQLPEHFAVIGLDMKDGSPDEFRAAVERWREDLLRMWKD